jgi:hypothetical protein
MSSVRLALLALPLLAIAAFTRRALVVTRDGARFEHRALGICWRCFPLGLAPIVKTGLGWGWSEIAVMPANPALAARLHDGERAVVADWCWDDTRADADAARIAAVVNAEIERLHAPAVR